MSISLFKTNTRQTSLGINQLEAVPVNPRHTCNKEKLNKNHLVTAKIAKSTMSSPIAFVICTSIIAVVCTVSSGSYADDHKAWLENFKAARHFSCKHPRPRAIFSEELLKKQVGPGETIVPAYTVLHRCDGYSGCCLLTNQICSVNASSPVQLTFQRLGITGKSYVTVTAYNHTACVCVSRNEQPKRSQWLEVIPVQLENY
ncbi:PDGF- and VEGF-related factor 3 [Carabus blaptoides fortunei]